MLRIRRVLSYYKPIDCVQTSPKIFRDVTLTLLTEQSLVGREMGGAIYILNTIPWCTVTFSPR